MKSFGARVYVPCVIFGELPTSAPMSQSIKGDKNAKELLGAIN